jgi:hypothetical protein
MRQKEVIIENLTIRLPNGWQGDPVLLVREISEQIQSQAHELKNTEQISLSLQGTYAGVANRVTEQLSKKLSVEFTRRNKKSSSGEGQ